MFTVITLTGFLALPTCEVSTDSDTELSYYISKHGNGYALRISAAGKPGKIVYRCYGPRDDGTNEIRGAVEA